MKIYFHELAQVELNNAVDYYEDCTHGLGLEFAGEVQVAIARIAKYPEAWSRLTRNTRRCLVHRFPFGVIYQINPECLYIIAVADLRREPKYWLDRG